MHLIRYSSPIIPITKAKSFSVFYRLNSKTVKVNQASTTTAGADIIQQNYKEKLLKKAQEEGFQTIEKLQNHWKNIIEEKKKQFNKIDILKDLEEYQQKMSNNNATGFTKSKGPLPAEDKKLKVPFKTLGSYLQLEKITELSKQEIEFLWRAKWAATKDSLCAVVPVDIFNKMLGNAKANPVFVLPLPRVVGEGKEPEGMELHYIQWQFLGSNTIHCIITSLAEYKLHTEFARPHTTFQFHLDLESEKKIVLMNGHVQTDMNVSVQDAQLLLLNIQRFYGAMGEETPMAKERLKILRDFTKGSTAFNVDTLIECAQSMEN
ncbi:Atp11p NDAI_0G01540 [Naumovozyma dairenensis CBS 421]|uniref:ATP synthase mitochondrial F1 complex assembly factor 1 n=1 Tax=Naumovozyma dairenensis (strain ATCC 10597 / BCRC 20456 / CBS 421 / NBRC 0211 / NRRL Y-12639) TaxID=1071378 RepID=G0WDR9_NAUDC|nr:hypothetical protein NDAI_0G01540 [Naumovozyma dairenensis CBS 421]CCD25930.2 hypothetical protein NDAI_0G01540 [Naumovozyma dairenensis CBS 421]